MSATINPEQAVLLDNSVGLRLLVEVPSEQEKPIRDALKSLSRTNGGPSAQTVLLDALRIAAEQTTGFPTFPARRSKSTFSSITPYP
jgi:hypothetical protein